MESTMNMSTVSLVTGGNPHQSCIDACMKCAQICEECFDMCLKEEDVKARINCIKSLQDCAQICSLTAWAMSRGSENINVLCNACATICDMCANECSMFKDQHCESCTDICRQCASECKKMASM